MKRIFLTVISVCLVLASVFGIYASYAGLDDVKAIKSSKDGTRISLSDKLSDLEPAIAELEALADENAKDEQDIVTGEITKTEGKPQVDKGQAEYDAGKQSLAQGQAKYNEGKAQLAQGEADYAAAQQRLEAGKAQYAESEKQLADAKVQIDAGEKQLDEGKAQLAKYTSAYNRYTELKSLPGNTVEIMTAILNPLLSGLGLRSIDELVAAYEDAEAQISAGEAKLAQGKADYAEAEQQLADAKSEIDAGEKQLAAARAQLDEGEAKLADAKKQLDAGEAKLNSAAVQLAEGKKTVSENLENADEALKTIGEYKSTQEFVETYISFFLGIDEISSKISDEADYASIAQAARDYISEDAQNVSDELALRQSLYSMLRILCVIGILAGLLGLLAAFLPGARKLRLAVAASCITAVGAVALNGYGLANGYQYFAYTYGDGEGGGALQLGAMVAVLAISVIAAVISIVCLKAYRRGLNQVAAAADGAAEPPPEPAGDFVPDDSEPDSGASSPAADAKFVPDDSEPQAGPTPDAEPEPEPDELERARLEYEEALKKFEEAKSKLK